jgi:hypothetical protein
VDDSSSTLRGCPPGDLSFKSQERAQQAVLDEQDKDRRLGRRPRQRYVRYCMCCGEYHVVVASPAWRRWPKTR